MKKFDLPTNSLIQRHIGPNQNDINEMLKENPEFVIDELSHLKDFI